MLVLNRRVGESLVIDGPCTIVVLGNKKGRVQVGIEADDDVRIMREELLEEDCRDA